MIRGFVHPGTRGMLSRVLAWAGVPRPKLSTATAAADCLLRRPSLHQINDDCSLSLAWSCPLDIPWSTADLDYNSVYSNPVLAGGVVYVASGFNKKVRR
jgi:hypothetical protein